VGLIVFPAIAIFEYAGIYIPFELTFILSFMLYSSYLTGWIKMAVILWVDGFLSREMFARNKPYFEASCGRKLNNSEDANKAYKEKYN